MQQVNNDSPLRYSFRSSCHLFASVEDRFLFIECHREDYEVRIMCRILQVSVSGFYAWRKRPVSARERKDGELVERIVDIFQEHRGVYGSPRIHSALQDEGIRVGRKRVVRLMQQVRLSAHCRSIEAWSRHGRIPWFRPLKTCWVVTSKPKPQIRNGRLT